jgi:hypothetical protein
MFLQQGYLGHGIGVWKLGVPENGVYMNIMSDNFSGKHLDAG